MRRLALSALGLALAVACGGKDDALDSGDSGAYAGAAFHGQAWLVEPFDLPWDACIDAKGEPLDVGRCWVCIELADGGQARSWWGAESEHGGDWPMEASADLGRWTLLEVDGDALRYDVDGATWTAYDYSNGDPWAQTGALAFTDARRRVAIWQGTATWGDSLCTVRP